MKKSIVIISLIICLSLTSCSEKYLISTPVSSVAYADYMVYYIQDSTLKMTNEYLPMEYDDIITKWLELCGLEGQFSIIRSLIYIDWIEQDEAHYAPKDGEYLYVYDKVYYLYFSADINEFLDREENGLYKEAFLKTLDEVQRVAEEYLAKHEETRVQY